MTNTEQRHAVAEIIGRSAPDGDPARNYFGMFNPFTDANDDYAVLEWAREKRGIPRDVGPLYRDFMFEYGVLQATRDEASSVLHEAYQIGDYAYALLKAQGEQ